MSFWSKYLGSLFGGGNTPQPGPGEFKCPLCGDIVAARELVTHARADDERFRVGRLIARIKQDHPDWVEADGACLKCMDHYRQAFGEPKIKLPR